ncbi:hypothetical protein AVEN_160237-1 [Araneus ventricosus]|uniref:Uncharacterized protein n=1 Tax=Araneus ventricosus TaxID=182803 RepID=A0A4Y2DLI3_ARAVE|nr:hypothetical protein AVEN_97707-1 [Araneus ventricosus]GBM16714.1 hypothetical protein AVEN_160237-1 [Araneus ventricosus]
MNDSRHDISTGTVYGVLTSIAGLGSTPPAGGTSYHRSGGNSTPHHYYTYQGSENSLTVRIPMYEMPPGGIIGNHKENVAPSSGYPVQITDWIARGMLRTIQNSP